MIGLIISKGSEYLFSSPSATIAEMPVISTQVFDIMKPVIMHV